ncbi:MAG: biotin--[acetyl-CoA-carboxylase] ligase [Vampirovibrionales bacterium]|nr:biotin--[acetyl-CoA-carboxylase] ligase [Vampirovibrionales bacterium]
MAPISSRTIDARACVEHAGGMQWYGYDTIDSTNDEAKRLLQAGALTRTSVITARGQTAGRGSQGRLWLSEHDAGLYMSVVHLPVGGQRLPLSDMFTRSAGAACAEALIAAYGLAIRIKPINDLYLAGGKLGGILTESVIQGDRALAVITGVGLNLRATARPLGPHAWAPATSLEATMDAEAFGALDPMALARLLAEAIDAQHQRVFAGDEAAVLARWRALTLDAPPSDRGI